MPEPISTSSPRGWDWSGWLFWLAAFALIMGVIAATDRPLPIAPPPPPMPVAPPPTAIPEAPPLELAPLTAEDAMAQNEKIPLITSDVVAAKPFVYAGVGENLVRATDCLATAMLYEAGDDQRGQLAVGQVVINRTRHPAFPNAICSTVFQGSERTTGCQFTFTCDGALARRYSEAAWARARANAARMLNGTVASEVGLSTHYHTNWVRPYWSDTLEKIAIVDTHLFFRWPGFWGTPAAFRNIISTTETPIAKLAPLFPAHRSGDTLIADQTLPVDEDAASAALVTKIIAARKEQGNRDTILVELNGRSLPEGFLTTALRLCGTREYCKLFGWTNPMLKPETEAMSDMQRAAMSFSYLRDDIAGFEKALWNCAEFKRDDPRLCMKR